MFDYAGTRTAEWADSNLAVQNHEKEVAFAIFPFCIVFLFLVLLLPAGTLYDAGYPKPSSSVIDAGDSV